MNDAGPFISTADQMQVGQSAINPAAFAAPQLPPPNPDSQFMRQRDYTGREAQLNYEMRQAPMPNEFSVDGGHPLFNSGHGNRISQYIAPTGYANPAVPTRSFPGMAPRPTRPTLAYNRVVGRGNPTMYAWPNQYYPGSSNTYIPIWEATGLIIKYTRSPNYFRINKYVKDLKVPRDVGYYLTLDGDQPYRVVNANDYLWTEDADAPGGRQERQGFGFVPYRTARYCFPFNLGRKSIQQAEWPIVAEHAAMAAAKSMTVRTMLNTTLATTTGNWTGSWGTNTSAASASWTDAASNTNEAIQTDINTACIAIEVASGGIVTDEEALHITIQPQLARGIAKSYEYKNYIKGSPDALAAITDQRNPNRRYGLAPYLYGLALTVENAVVVTTPKFANTATHGSVGRSYIWPIASAVICSKPQGIIQESEQTLDFSTFCARFYEMMTVESKDDPDNRRTVGRVVEDYIMTLQAPQTGYLITGIA